MFKRNWWWSSDHFLVKSFMSSWIYIVLVTLSVPCLVKCQQLNQPPHFVPGSGDMGRFSLSENTPVGSPVYQLKGK